MMVRRILPAVLALVLAGCATITPAERAAICRGTDWLRFGLNDGKLGVPPEAREAAFADCAGLGAPADREAYDLGRAQGLAEYCTVENGYRAGFEGRRYYRVCPPALEADFLQGFHHGRRELPPYRVYGGIGYWGVHPGPQTPPYWCGFWFPHCR